MNATLYSRVTAFALTVVALLGIILSAVGQEAALGENFLSFDWTHNILHVVLAGAAFLFGFGNLPANITRTFAIIFGFVYLALGIVGFIVGSNDPIAGMHLEVGENIIHLLIGVWCVVSGFGGRSA